MRKKKLKENIKTNKNMTNESSRNLKKSRKSMVDKVVEDEVRHNKGLKNRRFYLIKFCSLPSKKPY